MSINIPDNAPDNAPRRILDVDESIRFTDKLGKKMVYEYRECGALTYRR
ncbi:MAG TPA: hypothetical protein VKA95_07925 [Nitrososphaeraceae archaeon]|nr:hypothetical protein [Nitrososphaeraceae archaeon]